MNTDLRYIVVLCDCLHIRALSAASAVICAQSERRYCANSVECIPVIYLLVIYKRVWHVLERVRSNLWFTKDLKHTGNVYVVICYLQKGLNSTGNVYVVICDL